MPPKRRKGGAAKGKVKGKKAAAVAAEKEEMQRKCRNLLRVYQQCCTATGSVASARISRDCRAAIENERPLTKFILEPSQPVKPPARRSTVTSETPDSAKPAPSAAAEAPPILLRPLISAWKEVAYSYVQSLHVWQVELPDETTVDVALFLESPLGQQLQVLELMDTKLSPWSIGRLARPLGASRLTSIKLDYNHLLPPTLTSLCEALRANLQLRILSLNYCHLEPACGEALGTLAALSQLRELALRGNLLECEGASEILRPVVALCGSGELEKPPPLAKLDLRDNGMDGFGGGFVPVICMRVFKRLITSSPSLEELNLDDNAIGDGGARELLQAMQSRKEAGLTAIRVSLSPKVSPELFSAILELSVSHRKGGKRKGKKGKRKR